MTITSYFCFNWDICANTLPLCACCRKTLRTTGFTTGHCFWGNGVWSTSLPAIFLKLSCFFRSWEAEVWVWNSVFFVTFHLFFFSFPSSSFLAFLYFFQCFCPCTALLASFPWLSTAAVLIANTFFLLLPSLLWKKMEEKYWLNTFLRPWMCWFWIIFDFTLGTELFLQFFCTDLCRVCVCECVCASVVNMSHPLIVPTPIYTGN